MSRRGAYASGIAINAINCNQLLMQYVWNKHYCERKYNRFANLILRKHSLNGKTRKTIFCNDISGYDKDWAEEDAQSMYLL